MVHSSTESNALLGNVNAEFEQNWHGQVVACLDSQYKPLGRNANPESQLLLGNDVTKRVMTITENKKSLQNENSSRFDFVICDLQQDFEFLQ